VASGLAEACRVSLPRAVAEAVGRPVLAAAAAEEDTRKEMGVSAMDSSDFVVFQQQQQVSLGDLLDPDGMLELADIEHGPAGDALAPVVAGSSSSISANSSTAAHKDTSWPAGAACMKELLALRSARGAGALTKSGVWTEVERSVQEGFEGYRLRSWSAEQGTQSGKAALLRRVC